MSKVLIIAEHDGENLNPGTAKCVSCAAKIDGATIDVAVFASGGRAVADAAAKLDGVTRVLHIDDAANANALAAVLAPQIVALADGYDYVFGPSSTFGKDLMPRVAALLDAEQLSDVMDVLGPREFRRPIYAGNAIIDVSVPDGQTVVATVRTASWPAVDASGSAAVEAATPGVESARPTRAIVELKSGKRLTGRICRLSPTSSYPAAAALGSEENFETALLRFGRQALAPGSVPLVQPSMRAMCRMSMQVGQTGKIISHRICIIAFGISGCHSAPDRHQGRRYDRGDQQGRGGAYFRGRGYRTGWRSFRYRARAEGGLE